MRLYVHVPTDDDFKRFTNGLLSHGAMACVVASFHDLAGWFDSDEKDGDLSDYTKEHLEKLSGYAAQLMESEHLHGFCFVRKPWKERIIHYPNSLIICAINPFKVPKSERSHALSEQIDEKYRSTFFEIPELAFDGRLTSLAKRAIEDCLPTDHRCSLETPLWEVIVQPPQEVVFTHNFGFRPTGVLREAYTHYLNSLYLRVKHGATRMHPE